MMGVKILYCGGYQLPDKNAAAQRVIGIAKGFRELGDDVVFLNSLKGSTKSGEEEKDYFGFRCIEYRRESDFDYLISAQTTLRMIKRVGPDVVIAYNYPAVALNRIRKYCKAKRIRCCADVTEWYDAAGDTAIARCIKGIDTAFRMKVVHKKMDGIIAISRYLFEYYKDSVKTVLIPPTVDISDEKWCGSEQRDMCSTSFVYAGSPSASKERLDKIIGALELVEKYEKTKLQIVGITEEQFRRMYSWNGNIPASACFWGRVEHIKALQIVKQSDWAVILRDRNRVVEAGFPTKLVESISCGTPVIANRFSNIFDYLTEKNSICVEDMDNIADYMIQACEKKRAVDRTLFDYHNYLKNMKELLRDSV